MNRGSQKFCIDKLSNNKMGQNNSLVGELLYRVWGLGKFFDGLVMYV